MKDTLKPDYSNIHKTTLHKFDFRKWSEIIAFCLRKSGEILSSAAFSNRIAEKCSQSDMTPYETSHLKERKKNTWQCLKKKKKIYLCIYLSIYLPCIYDLPVCVSTQLSICHFCVSVSLCLFLSSHHLCIYHLIIYLFFFFFFLSVYSPYSLSPKRYFWLYISLVEHMLHCSIVGCFICLINLILCFPSV